MQGPLVKQPCWGCGQCPSHRAPGTLQTSCTINLLHMERWHLWRLIGLPVVTERISASERGKFTLLHDMQPDCQPAGPSQGRGQCSRESTSFICIAFYSTILKGRQLALAPREVSGQLSDNLPKQGNFCCHLDTQDSGAKTGCLQFFLHERHFLPDNVFFFKLSISNYRLWIYWFNFLQCLQ